MVEYRRAENGEQKKASRLPGHYTSMHNKKEVMHISTTKIIRISSLVQVISKLSSAFSQARALLASCLLIMDRARYCYDSEVMGYQDTWEARLGEVLSCHRETANAFNSFAVCMKKDGAIVGHVPRKISSICSLFLRNNGYD